MVEHSLQGKPTHVDSREREVALVFVAGLGSSPRNWTYLRDVLPGEVGAVIATKSAESNSVQSSPYGPDCPRSLEVYFRGIDEALDSVDAESIFLVCHSLGCVIGAGYSVYGRNRTRLSGQILLSPLIIRQVESFAHPVGKGVRHPLALFQAVYFVLIAGVPWPAALRHKVLSNDGLRSALFWPIDRLPRRISSEFALELTNLTEQSTVKSQAINADDYAAEKWIPNPPIPTLYVEGDRDRLGSIKDRVLIMDHQQSSFEIIADAGHWLHVERPEEVWLRIERFGGELLR